MKETGSPGPTEGTVDDPGSDSLLGDGAPGTSDEVPEPLDDTPDPPAVLFVGAGSGAGDVRGGVLAGDVGEAGRGVGAGVVFVGLGLGLAVGLVGFGAARRFFFVRRF